MNKVNIIILIALLGLSLIAPTSGQSEQKYKSFTPEQYDKKDYLISKHDIQHGELTLRIVQVKTFYNFITTPHHCRVWLDIIKAKRNIFRRYYDDIEPVGFSFGLFVPKVQPPLPYFAVIKNGDYDGRLFLVRNNGKVHDLMGGFYFITKNKRYLFSQYASDMEGLVVFDLKSDRIVFSSDKIPYIHQWYIKDEDYFFTESEWTPSNLGSPTSKVGIGYFYNFTTHQIVSKKITVADIAAAKVLEYDFDPREYEDCTMKPDKSLKQDATKNTK